jgi:septum formation protein
MTATAVTHWSPTDVEWQTRDIILASASPVRRRVLQACGLAIEVVPAMVDEEAVRQEAAAAHISYLDLARRLAGKKAIEVSRRFRSSWVIGADQVLISGKRLFTKPASLAAARADLKTLRGQWHELTSAAAVAVDGELVWQYVDHARLKMRPFSDQFLESYLAIADPAILSTVGGYQVEGPGIQLFEHLDGDFFTILGLPLLPLLAFLRSRQCLAA